MRQGAGESLRSLKMVGTCRECGEFAQHGIYEWRGGALARTFHQFDTLMQGRTRWDAIEPAELIESQAERDENFQVKFRQRTTPITISVARA
jgi:hypothetical protein